MDGHYIIKQKFIRFGKSVNYMSVLMSKTITYTKRKQKHFI